jgi:acetylornithine deacetylase/succinyl-diaminopimelate desuccinylase-like protein
MIPERALAFARAHSGRFVEELAELVRFPTVSADPRRAADVGRCARWLAGHLRSLGLERVRVLATGGNPVVLAESRTAPGRPTLLVYGHYDVQPADPPGAWTSPPFEPVVRGGALYGRGSSDDKGQLFVHLKAVESYVRTGGLPVNVVILLDGEEEIGSPSLGHFVERQRESLRADTAVVSDSDMLGRGRPALTTALRGLLAFDLELRGPGHDLHSGSHGGAVHNPLQALCELVASLHDGAGRITIPGFYDRVRAIPPAERAALARTAPTDAAVLAEAEAPAGWGERGFSLHERITIRPALTVNGLAGGYAGPGSKGVIPSRAAAKLGFRLVVDQRPLEIEGLLRQHLAAVVPPTIRVGLRRTTVADPVEIDTRHPAIHAAGKACARAFGQPPVLRRSGGTVPIVNLLQSVLEMPVVVMGFGLPDAHPHGPDEHFDLPTFERAIAASILFLEGVARMGAPVAGPLAAQVR